jgi:hypothetical protein
VATITLLVTMLLPAIGLVTATGAALQAHFPAPDLLAVLMGAALFVLLFVGGLLIGAAAWLLVARYFVERAVIEPFYLCRGAPLYSDLSARLFQSAYRDRHRPTGK